MAFRVNLLASRNTAVDKTRRISTHQRMPRSGSLLDELNLRHRQTPFCTSFLPARIAVSQSMASLESLEMAQYSIEKLEVDTTTDFDWSVVPHNKLIIRCLWPACWGSWLGTSTNSAAVGRTPRPRFCFSPQAWSNERPRTASRSTTDFLHVAEQLQRKACRPFKPNYNDE